MDAGVNDATYSVLSKFFDVDSLMSKFVVPDLNVRIERESLLLHIQYNRIIEPRPLMYKAARIAAEMCNAGSVIVDDDFDSDDAIRRCIGEVDRSKSPGLPWLERYGSVTNGFVLDTLGEAEVIRLVRIALNSKSQSHTRTFLKQELHKLAKVLEGRIRIISSIGLIEQIRDRVLFTRLSENLIDAFPNIPVAVGWADKGGKFIGMLQQAPSGHRIVSMDKRAWDWTVSKLHIFLLNIFLHYMFKGRKEVVERLIAYINNQIEAMYGPGHRIQLSEGEVFEQTDWGIWKSGGFLTLIGNAIMQLCLDVLAKLELGFDEMEIKTKFWFRSFGDDTIQSYPRRYDSDPKKSLDAYIAKMQELGAIIPEEDLYVSDQLEGHEFCGHVIQTVKVFGRKVWGLIPKRLGKQISNLIYQSSENVFETLASMKLNWVADEDSWNKLNNAFLDLMALLPKYTESAKRLLRNRAQDLAIAYGDFLD